MTQEQLQTLEKGNKTLGTKGANAKVWSNLVNNGVAIGITPEVSLQKAGSQILVVVKKGDKTFASAVSKNPSGGLKLSPLVPDAKSKPAAPSIQTPQTAQSAQTNNLKESLQQQGIELVGQPELRTKMTQEQLQTLEKGNKTLGAKGANAKVWSNLVNNGVAIGITPEVSLQKAGSQILVVVKKGDKTFASAVSKNPSGGLKLSPLVPENNSSTGIPQKKKNPSENTAAKPTNGSADSKKKAAENTIKDEATRLIKIANEAMLENKPAVVFSQTIRLRALQTKATNGGFKDLAATIGVHIKDLDGRRINLQHTNTAAMGSAGGGNPPRNDNGNADDVPYENRSETIWTPERVRADWANVDRSGLKNLSDSDIDKIIHRTGRLLENTDLSSNDRSEFKEKLNRANLEKNRRQIANSPREATFRGGGRFVVKAGDNSLIVDVWVATGNVPRPNIEDINRGPRPENSAEAVDRVASWLAANMPRDVGWAVKPSLPIATPFMNQVGINYGNYMEIGDVDAGIKSGAILYDPSATGPKYKLNTYKNAADENVMRYPIAMTIGVRAGITPTSFPLVPPLPVSAGIVRSSEIKKNFDSTVAINDELLMSINSALNNGLAAQRWKDKGQDTVRKVIQINFSIPRLPAREGSYELPDGWKNLQENLLTQEVRNNRKLWATFTASALTFGIPENIRDFDFRAGARVEKVEKPASQNSLPSTERQLPPAPVRFKFFASRDNLTEIISEGVSVADTSRRVDSDLKGLLIFTGQKSIPMTGAVVNAIEGNPMEDTDFPLIIDFLRSIRSPLNNSNLIDGLIFDIQNTRAVRRPLSQQVQEQIRQAIKNYAR